MIFAIRETLAFPFYILALVFIFLDTFILYGFRAAMDTLVEMTNEEE